MDYTNTLKYLFDSAPMFQQIGGKAYKPGLGTTHSLDKHFGHPHRKYKTIHIAGTNGKGSCSHTIAAVLQAAGYRVGLYTSPHLVDFRERVRVNGEVMPESYVIRFVEEHRPFFEPLHPSFFELTTSMAFCYFAEQKIDVAVVEVGLGGRLDCTNIIQPDLCVITNISLDHTQYLGDTLPKIAKEKAGIIKENIPVIIGNASGSVKQVFTKKAHAVGAPLLYAEQAMKGYQTTHVSVQDLRDCLSSSQPKNAQEVEDLQQLIAKDKDLLRYTCAPKLSEAIYGELTGDCQYENGRTILCALRTLQEVGYTIPAGAIRKGFGYVCELTGLMGRWQKLQTNPTVICDTGHNVAGIRYIVQQLTAAMQNGTGKLHIVFGMVNDKDIHSVLHLLPKEAIYYFTRASVKRALPEKELMELATEAGLHGSSYPTVVEAVKDAQTKSLPEDFIFVGGSSFIVADLLTNRDALNFH